MDVTCIYCGRQTVADASGRCPYCLHRIRSDESRGERIATPLMGKVSRPIHVGSVSQPARGKKGLRGFRDVTFLTLGIALPLVVYLAYSIYQKSTSPSIALSTLSAGVAQIKSGESIGSGFLIDSRGFLVTCSHVIGSDLPDLSSLTVRMHDNQRYSGDDLGLVYNDPELDLALLYIKPRTIANYPCIPLGQSINPNQQVLVAGYPFGSFNTASGRISLGNEVMYFGQPLLAFDAVLDPGYSGGPVIIPDGRVAGVAKAIAGRGESFAVPVRYVRCFFDQPQTAEILDSIYLLNNLDALPRQKLRPTYSFDFTSMSDSDVRDYFLMVPSDGWKTQASFMSQGTLFRTHRLYFYKISDRPNRIDVTAPDQEGFVLTRDAFANVILKATFIYRHRLDGWRNIDVGVVFRFQDSANYYRFSTYSGRKRDPRKTVFEQDAGGLWKVGDGYEFCTATALGIRPFQAHRRYDIQIVAIGNTYSVYIDNVKCLEWSDPGPMYPRAGRVGFRVVSGLAEFLELQVYEL